MDEAIADFVRLGARVETCRTRPLRETNDVKIVIAETELLAIHHADLVARPGDFGRDFQSRVIPACLFHSLDYVQAARAQRRIIAAMRPLYERYDVLLTCAFGPAPRLDAHRTANFWRRPNTLTPANVTGGPSLVVPCGFSNGLPLGLQIIGRPFGDATVLRAGHAYQQATDWHLRRPQLVSGAPQPKVTPHADEPALAGVDPATRDRARQMALRAGLNLNAEQMDLLFQAAPLAFEMADRLRKPRERSDEPSFVWRASS
jgi:aspartyl-tRNA(Asn)/glutamyl-tRNA(Gln) amidotransferase subunit A